MIVKPVISFLNHDPDPKFSIKVASIVMAMTGNPAYPAPTPGLDLVAAALAKFVTAKSMSGGGGVMLTCDKKAKRQALVILVRALAAYVSVACQGDYGALLSSGFPTHKPRRQAAGIFPAPAAPRLKQGIHSGQLLARVRPVTGSIFFTWRLTDDKTGVVVQTPQGSAASISFRQLTPGTVYRVEVSVSSTAGASNWSQMSTQMVI